MTTEERLEKLEKELAKAKRKSRLMLVAAVMTVAGMFLLGAEGDQSPMVIRAQSFAVVDQNGNALAILGLGTDGQPGLFLYDQNSHVRGGLTVAENGVSTLGIYDQNGSPRAVLGVDKNGTPGLALLDQSGTIYWHAP